MGWTSCLPAICLSKTSIRVSRKSYGAFEERPFSKENVKQVSAFEFCGHENKESSHKSFSFMCNYCAHCSESNTNLFEHFIRNHVFLCSICSFAGIGRSSILEHCLDKHEKIMKDKQCCTKFHMLNMEKLVQELDAHSQGFRKWHQNKSSSFNTSLSRSDCSSDEEFIKPFPGEGGPKNSWYLTQSSDEESDAGSETHLQSRSWKISYPASSHASKSRDISPSSSIHMKNPEQHGAKSRESIVHFLDEDSSSHQGHGNGEEFSESSQLDLFCANEGNEMDPDDMSESIFHDHQEMFMVSRLPFPIRQDDSPNDPFNEPTSQPDPPSILQSILQKDKVDHMDNPCSNGGGICQLADHDIGLSSPLGIGSNIQSLSDADKKSLQMQEQVEAAITKPTMLICNDVLPKLSVETKPETSLPTVNQLSVSNMDCLSSCCKKKADAPTKCGENGLEGLDNFLVPSNSKDEIETRDEQAHKDQLVVKETSSDGKAQFALLRNLLKDNCKQNASENVELPKALVDNVHMSGTVLNASDMSLRDLLLMDTPFPFSSRLRVKRDDAVHSIVVSCDLCKQYFTNESMLARHAQLCKGNIPRSIPHSKSQSKSLVKRLDGFHGNKHHSFLPRHIHSSLRRDHFAASQVLSKFSNNHLQLTLNPKDVSYEDMFQTDDRSHQEYGESPIQSRIRHRRTRLENFMALRLKSKHGQMGGQSSSAIDGSVIKRMKRKAVQDDDYDPESESSESSDGVSQNSVKQRKKSKRTRKNLVSLPREPREKIPPAMGLMSRLCEKALDDQTANSHLEQTNKFSSFLSSSLSLSSSSSILSSSSSSFMSVAPTASSECTSVRQAEADILLPTMSLSSNSRSKEVKECEEIRITQPSQATDDAVRKSDTQAALKDVKRSSLADTNNGKKSLLNLSSTLLHHLLVMPAKQLSYQHTHERSKKSPQNVSILEFDNAIPPRLNGKQVEVKNTLEKRINISETGTEREEKFRTTPQDVKQQTDDNMASESSPHRRGKMLRHRSQSVTEGIHPTRESIKEFKHSCCFSSRLSASMMDVPDPPSMPALNPVASPTPKLRRWPSLPSTKSSFLSPSLPNSVSNQAENCKEQLDAAAKQSSTRMSSPDLLGSLKSSADPSDPSDPATSFVEEPTSACQSLLRNLLTQPKQGASSL